MDWYNEIYTYVNEAAQSSHLRNHVDARAVTDYLDWRGLNPHYINLGELLFCAMDCRDASEIIHRLFNIFRKSIVFDMKLDAWVLRGLAYDEAGRCRIVSQRTLCDGDKSKLDAIDAYLQLDH